MFLNNDSQYRWVNGTIGTIVEIDEEAEELTVQLPSNNLVCVYAQMVYV